MDDNTILEVRNLDKHFGGIKAVDGASFKLYENEILAIVGDNGSGKTTLIKSIVGVYKKDRGDIYLYGTKIHINNTREAQMYGIETVHQFRGLVPVLDAPKNLFLGRELYYKNALGKIFKLINDKAMVTETKSLLNDFGVSLKNISEDISVLSGGQQQSINVGRAIYWKGKILIFDEPTNNLGVREQLKAIDLIEKIKQNYKVSMIVISHNLEHVFYLADRILVMRNGKIEGIVSKKDVDKNEIISLITGLSK